MPIAGDVKWNEGVEGVLGGPAGGLVGVLAACASGGPPCVAPWRIVISLRPPLALR